MTNVESERYTAVTLMLLRIVYNPGLAFLYVAFVANPSYIATLYQLQTENRRIWPNWPSLAKTNKYDTLERKLSIWIVGNFEKWSLEHISRVSCQKSPTRHAYAWQIGPFWQDTLDMWLTARSTLEVVYFGMWLTCSLNICRTTWELEPHLQRYQELMALQWSYNEHDGASNNRRIDCLLIRLFRRR